MSYSNFKVDTIQHDKMKELAKQNGRTIIDEYRIALENHIAIETQEIVLRDSNIENILNDRLSKMENRLAGMLGRVGMDAAMILMGELILLARELKTTDQNVLMDKLRREAAKHWSRPYRSE